MKAGLSRTLSLSVWCVCVCVCVCALLEATVQQHKSVSYAHTVMHCNSNCMSGSAEPVNVNVQNGTFVFLRCSLFALVFPQAITQPIFSPPPSSPPALPPSPPPPDRRR